MMITCLFPVRNPPPPPLRGNLNHPSSLLQSEERNKYPTEGGGGGGVTDPTYRNVTKQIKRMQAGNDISIDCLKSAKSRPYVLP